MMVSVVLFVLLFDADTMREAMILCDAEIRHADLMNKLDEVIDALHTLATILRGIAGVLDEINTNVNLIAQDVYAMREGQEQLQYSMNSIQRSIDNMNTYVHSR